MTYFDQSVALAYSSAIDILVERALLTSQGNTYSWMYSSILFPLWNAIGHIQL